MGDVRVPVLGNIKDLISGGVKDGIQNPYRALRLQRTAPGDVNMQGGGTTWQKERKLR